MASDISKSRSSQNGFRAPDNPLPRLMAKHQKGQRSTFHLGPFLSIAALRDRGLPFNDVFRDEGTMAEAARQNFELGFESTVLPFDMNDVDGVQVDRACDTVHVRKRIPDHLPLFTGCGANDMLAISEPEAVAREVRERLDQGATGVSPPADIYPAARPENIHAFLTALGR